MEDERGHADDWPPVSRSRFVLRDSRSGRSGLDVAPFEIAVCAYEAAWKVLGGEMVALGSPFTDQITHTLPHARPRPIL